MNKIVWSADKDEWATSQDFFDGLNSKYYFTLDPCADPNNAKCSKFYTIDDDGLTKDWGGETVFCNPPYSKAKDWVKKALEESSKSNTKVVLLVAARTDTKFFHDYCTKASQIFFIKGRLKFGGSKNSAPFPSMVVVFDSTKSNLSFGRMDTKGNKI